MKKYNGPGTYIEEHGDPRHMSRRQLIAQGFLGGLSSVVGAFGTIVAVLKTSVRL